MSVSSFATIRTPKTGFDLDKSSTTTHDEEIRAIRALGILLESRLIDQMEYERRVAIYQKK